MRTAHLKTKKELQHRLKYLINLSIGSNCSPSSQEWVSSEHAANANRIRQEEIKEIKERLNHE